MDANGTRYHLLLGESDWMRRTLADPPGSAAYDRRREELTLRRREFVFDQRVGDIAPDLFRRRGAARDAYGNIYWIDQDARTIRVQSSGSGTSSVFWRPGLHAAPEPDRNLGAFAPPPEAGPQPPPAQALPLAGLAVTEDHYLVAGTLDPQGILVFDLHSEGPPRQELWPAGVELKPFDLCARACGGCFVLDRTHARLWELDRHFLVVTRRLDLDPATVTDFQPVEGGGPPPASEPRAHRTIALADAVELGGDPIAIEPAPKGRILVLDRNESAPPSSVRLLQAGEGTGPTLALEDSSIAIRVVAHDMALVPNEELGTLFIVDRSGNQSFAFELGLQGGTLTGKLEPAYYPMRVFGGKALIGGAGDPVYDFGDGWIPLKSQSRPRFETESTLYAEAFDGHAPGTVWHRLLLDACIPPDASVAVESRAADDERELASADWQPEPRLYRRGNGSELPFLPEEASSDHGTWELLFQRARGRHLQLRLVLSGDGRTSPALHALRVYYPRFSYLERYLPKVYREDPVSASFLDRFLANLEGIQTGIEDRVAGAQALFDPRTTPRETLEWLMGWFDFASDPAWHEERRRLFLRHALEVFGQRGTVPGIQLALRLALDPCDDEQLFQGETPTRSTSRIVERFRTRRTPPVVLGDPNELAGPRVGTLLPRWDPAQGEDELQRRWRAYLDDESAEFTLEDSSERARKFSREVLGFERPGSFDPTIWTSFLGSRYGSIAALNTAYGLVGDQRYAAFEKVVFPAEPPPDGRALVDWYQFLTVVLPSSRAAHRFTVLLPMPPAQDERRSPEDRRAIALRVIELQKPAHTTFDVKFFWAAFRVGEVRLGTDTVLDLGSRDPRLRQPLVLGREHAGESYLGGKHAPTAGHVGRDPLDR